MDRYNNKILDLLRNTTNIGPIRRSFTRIIMYYLIDRYKTVGYRGENFLPIFLEIVKSDRKKEFLHEWLKKLEIGEEIFMEIMKQIHSISIFNPVLDTRINFGNLGFGISQLVPIICEGISRENSLIIIEQPELHLHPKLQTTLSDFFIFAYKEYGNTFIVETHSESMLLRLQRRIAERKIEKNDLGIYYFELKKEGTKVSKITLNNNGTLDVWPKGFFEEDIEESTKMFQAITGENDNS